MIGNQQSARDCHKSSLQNNSLFNPRNSAFNSQQLVSFAQTTQNEMQASSKLDPNVVSTKLKRSFDLCGTSPNRLTLEIREATFHGIILS